MLSQQGHLGTPHYLGSPWSYYQLSKCIKMHQNPASWRPHIKDCKKSVTYDRSGSASWTRESSWNRFPNSPNFPSGFPGILLGLGPPGTPIGQSRVAVVGHVSMIQSLHPMTLAQRLHNKDWRLFTHPVSCQKRGHTRCHHIRSQVQIFTNIRAHDWLEWFDCVMPDTSCLLYPCRQGTSSPMPNHTVFRRARGVANSTWPVLCPRSAAMVKYQSVFLQSIAV